MGFVKSKRWTAMAMTMTLGLGLGFICLAEAGTLQEDYRETVGRRTDLEDKRADYERRQQEGSDLLQKTTSDLNDCVYQSRLKVLEKRQRHMYQTWRELWESRLKEAEIARKSTEESRRSIQSLWRDMGNVREGFEKRRQDIESAHKAKGPGTPYEAEFRAYMDAIEKDYFQHIENELFASYDDYLSGVSGYIRFLKNSLDLCHESMGLDVAPSN